MGRLISLHRLRLPHHQGCLATALSLAALGCGANSASDEADGGNVRPGVVDAAGEPGDGGQGADSGTGGGSDGGGGSGTDGDGGTGPGSDGGTGPGSDGGTGGSPDAGQSGSTTACSIGDGQALWRLTFPSGMAGYATVDEWDNGCEYSLANQACSLSGEPHNYANFGPGVVFNSSSDFFRVRFSAAGLNFSQATLLISAHADGGGIPNAVLESPLYGSLSFAPTVPISTHRTYAVDWSDFLSPSDNPNLTAVTLRSNPTGLAVSAIELCVQ